MFYSFGRVSAVLGMNLKDYYPRGKRFFIGLHEKGGKYHEVPVHHKAEEYLDAALTSKAMCLVSDIQMGSISGINMVRQLSATGLIVKRGQELDPLAAARLHELALCYNAMGNYDQAAAAAKKAVELNPNFVPAYGQWGRALSQTHQHEEAIQKLKTAVERDKGRPYFPFARSTRRTRPETDATRESFASNGCLPFSKAFPIPKRRRQYSVELRVAAMSVSPLWPPSLPFFFMRRVPKGSARSSVTTIRFSSGIFSD
jgi:tetratricopeptide (TPR) repeat protein